MRTTSRGNLPWLSGELPRNHCSIATSSMRHAVGAEVVVRTPAVTMALTPEPSREARLANTQVLVNYRGVAGIDSPARGDAARAGPLAGDRSA